MSIATRLPLAAAAVIAAGAAAWTLAPRGAADLPPLAASAQEARAGEVAPMVLGSEEAPVTLVEYASYSCPHCATFHDEVWPQLKRDYVDAGLVRFEYREVYFDGDRPSLWASMVARCGGEAGFFGITDLIYERQDEWRGRPPAQTADTLRRIGRAAGLAEEEIDACLTDRAKAEALVARSTQNVREDGITSTPSFVIDGERHGNMSYPDLREVLDARLAEAGEG